MFLLYNLLLTILSPFWVPWMLWRAYRRGEKPNWRERQGDYRESIPKKGARPRLWVHAVSVGEVVAAQPLLRALRQELPGYEIVLSVTTSSGHQTVREAEPKLYDYLVYLPIDLPRFTLSAMQRVRPDALIVMETELWFNLFWAAEAFDAKVFVVNARLSDRSFPRASKLAFFYRPLLAMVDGVLAQSETDAERFRRLGARHVQTVGNLKFDQAIEGVEDTTDWQKELKLEPGKPVVVVGSLRAEEFGELSDIISNNPYPQWVVAPRHLERSVEFVKEMTNRSLKVGLRSERTGGGVVVLDSYGELSQVYRVADVVVVGGSLKKLGGQNIIQPLAQGKPVLYGPYMANFRDVADLAEGAGASIRCLSEQDLAGKIQELLEDPERCERMGRAAHELVENNVGASGRTAALIAGAVTSKGG